MNLRYPIAITICNRQQKLLFSVHINCNFTHITVSCKRELNFPRIINRCCWLWSPYVIGQTIIFLPCDFYLSFFFFSFPRLIPAAVDWMSTILPHMVWP